MDNGDDDDGNDGSGNDIIDDDDHVDDGDAMVQINRAVKCYVNTSAGLSEQWSMDAEMSEKIINNLLRNVVYLVIEILNEELLKVNWMEISLLFLKLFQPHFSWNFFMDIFNFFLSNIFM